MIRLDFVNSHVGGQKGEIISNKIICAKTTFFEVLGTKRIEESCEKLRINFLDALEKGRIHNLSFPKEVLVNQLALPFALIEPKIIEVELHEGAPEDNHCMEVSPISIEDGIYRLHVYLNTFLELQGDYIWDNQGYSRIVSRDGDYLIESPRSFTVKTSAFHEFLHTSHEAKWFGREDGIIRPNLIAINAILCSVELVDNFT